MTYDAHSAKIVSATGTRSSAKSVTHCMWRSSQISCHIVFVSFDAGDHASTATAASAHTTQLYVATAAAMMIARHHGRVVSQRASSAPNAKQQLGSTERSSANATFSRVTPSWSVPASRQAAR